MVKSNSLGLVAVGSRVCLWGGSSSDTYGSVFPFKTISTNPICSNLTLTNVVAIKKGIGGENVRCSSIKHCTNAFTSVSSYARVVEEAGGLR